MLFQPQGSVYLYPGRLVAQTGGPPLVMDLHRRLYTPVEVEFIIPDDETQGQKLRTAGFNAHSSR
jgi:hypothetical protein